MGYPSDLHISSAIGREHLVHSGPLGGSHRIEVITMHARFIQPGPAEGGRGIRGTFYPSQASEGARSIGPALGKVALVLIAMAVVRTIVANHGHRDEESRQSRRRRMIAELHRELHAEEPSAG
jgi:hypothetical protein